MCGNVYFFRKEVDWSSLHYGINIPVTFQDTHYFATERGAEKKIQIIMEGKSFSAKLNNINFRRDKYPNHKDLLQIRYHENSELAQYLKSVFYSSYSFLAVEKAKLINRRQRILIPNEKREYIAIYGTIQQDILCFEPITLTDFCESYEFVSSHSEEDIERIINATDAASIVGIEKISKIRKLDRSISENLKKLYEHRCQICGITLGIEYGTKISHTHHIEYFVRSLNNDAKNILIICPNHHSIIHTTNPRFDASAKRFHYPNGFSEGLKLNLHL